MDFFSREGVHVSLALTPSKRGRTASKDFLTTWHYAICNKNNKKDRGKGSSLKGGRGDENLQLKHPAEPKYTREKNQNY